MIIIHQLLLYSSFLNGLAIDICNCLMAIIQVLAKIFATVSWQSFRYDLNQIPYDYTSEMTNGFTGLDLIEFLKNYGQRFIALYRRQ